MLIEDDILRLWCQLGQNVRVPGISDQYATLAAVWRADRRSYAKQQMPRMVGTIEWPGVRKIGPKRHLQIDHRNTRRTCRGENAGGWRHRSADHRNIDSGAVKHSAIGSEIVLHIHYNDRSPGDIDRDRLRLRFDRHDPSLTWHNPTALRDYSNAQRTKLSEWLGCTLDWGSAGMRSLYDARVVE